MTGGRGARSSRRAQGGGGSCYTAMPYDSGMTSHAYGTEDNGFNTGAAYTINY